MKTGVFKNELKERCDKKFATLKSKFKGKANTRGTVSGVAANLKVYEKFLVETSDMVAACANEITPFHEIKANEIKEIATEQIRSYMSVIKKTAKF